jgi:hypothetical protein
LSVEKEKKKARHRIEICAMAFQPIRPVLAHKAAEAAYFPSSSWPAAGRQKRTATGLPLAGQGCWRHCTIGL